MTHPLQDELRTDVYRLRNAGAQDPPAAAAQIQATTTTTTKSYFQVARIGQDSTNQLNTDIRVAETCFLGPGKLADVPSAARETLYQVLDQVRLDLQDGPSSSASPRTPLDASLTELLYAYYPAGGFYRVHRDAVPGSASTLRRYSLLLYLNDRDDNWDLARDGGALRLHLGPYLDIDCWDDDATVLGQHEDVVPAGGTLVLFASDAIPHEVLDTNRERLAVVGWYNRPLRGWTDVAELTAAGDSNVSPIRLAMVAVALALVTVGVLGLVQ